MQVFLRNPHTGEKKQRKRGFSWTTLIFGIFPALFRADWKFVGIGLAVVANSLITFGLSSLVYWIVAAFKYNEWHLNDLRNKGFVEVRQAEFYGHRALATS